MVKIFKVNHYSKPIMCNHICSLIAYMGNHQNSNNGHVG